MRSFGAGNALGQHQQDYRINITSLPLWALFGPRAPFDLGPECAPKRTSAKRFKYLSHTLRRSFARRGYPGDPGELMNPSAAHFEEPIRGNKPATVPARPGHALRRAPDTIRTCDLCRKEGYATLKMKPPQPSRPLLLPTRSLEWDRDGKLFDGPEARALLPANAVRRHGQRSPGQSNIKL